MIAGADFDRERMGAAAGDETIAATDVADLLVRRGMAFRDAHGVVAALVRTPRSDSAARAVGAERRGAGRARRAAGLGSETAARLRQGARARVLAESKVSEGGTALPQVREQLSWRAPRWPKGVSDCELAGASTRARA